MCEDIQDSLDTLNQLSCIFLNQSTTPGYMLCHYMLELFNVSLVKNDYVQYVSSMECISRILLTFCMSALAEKLLSREILIHGQLHHPLVLSEVTAT